MTKYEVIIEARNGREIVWARRFWCHAIDKTDAIDLARAEYPGGNVFNATAQ